MPPPTITCDNSHINFIVKKHPPPRWLRSTLTPNPTPINPTYKLPLRLINYTNRSAVATFELCLTRPTLSHTPSPSLERTRHDLGKQMIRSWEYIVYIKPHIKSGCEEDFLWFWDVR